MLLLVALPMSAAAAGGGSEIAAWRLLSGPVNPPQKSGHAAIHDALRHRMVIVDAGLPHELWTLTLPAIGPPSWIRVPVGGSEFPTWRTLICAVLDSARDRVLVFGGSQGFASTNEVWSLSLGDEPRWTLIVPQGAPPARRCQSAAIYDPVRDRMIVYGGAWDAGYEDEVIYADVWSLELGETPRWVQLAPLGTLPNKRKGASAVYDPAGDRMLLFGGWAMVPVAYPPSGSTPVVSDETWSLSLSGVPQWRLIPVTAAPPGRQETVAVVDPKRGQLIVSGGNSWQWSHTMDDTWTLPLDAGRSGSPPTWTRLPTPAGSPAVDQHAAIYSPERDGLIQYGGVGAGNLCFELDLSTAVWSPIVDGSGPFPIPRTMPTLIADPVLPRLRLFGGGWGCQHDLWEIPLQGPAKWSLLPASGIAPTCGDPSFVPDPVRRRLLCITGGSDQYRGTINEVWAMPFDEPRVWTRFQTRGPDPPPRFGYGLTYDPVRDRVLLFGGSTWQTPARNYADDRDDLWELSLDDFTWTQLTPANSPGPRSVSSMHYEPAGDRLIVAGGTSHPGYRSSMSRSDCWALELAGDSLRWSHFAPDLPGTGRSPYDAPPQRMALDPLRDRLVYWDGIGSAWTLALERPDAWHALELSGVPPPARDYFGLTYDARGDQMIVFGGDDGSLLADLRALRFSDEVPVVLRRLWERGGTLPRHGLIHAAILGSATFSVDSILTETITLGGAPAFDVLPRGRRGERHDVNGDRFEDLELKFRAESLHVAPHDSMLRLLARTPHFAIRGVAVPEVRQLGRWPGWPSQSSATGRVLSLTSMNPSLATLKIRLSLASASPARIEIYDVAGRRVQERELAGWGPGEHVIEFESGRLRPGLYLIRLRQDGHQVANRALLVR